MRWPKLRLADDQAVADSGGETPAEQVLTVSAEDGESVGAERRFRWARAFAYCWRPPRAI